MNVADASRLKMQNGMKSEPIGELLPWTLAPIFAHGSITHKYPSQEESHFFAPHRFFVAQIAFLVAQPLLAVHSVAQVGRRRMSGDLNPFRFWVCHAPAVAGCVVGHNPRCAAQGKPLSVRAEPGSPRHAGLACIEVGSEESLSAFRCLRPSLQLVAPPRRKWHSHCADGWRGTVTLGCAV